MIMIEHNSLYIQNVNSIRLMQRFPDVSQDKHNPQFAELLGKEMRCNENVGNTKNNVH